MESQYREKTLHDGEMLRRSIEKSPLTLSGVARKMDIAHSTLLSFYKRPNLRTSVLWQASQILECNLFFDIGKELNHFGQPKKG
ncbi:MAG: hypothetical protein LBV41_01085 [Cytophagaceae bacterium]|jgi:hypothetical protein|nr:hypothetical protein [Cytophagaceae bacterium]